MWRHETSRLVHHRTVGLLMAKMVWMDSAGAGVRCETLPEVGRAGAGEIEPFPSLKGLGKLFWCTSHLVTCEWHALHEFDLHLSSIHNIPPPQTMFHHFISWNCPCILLWAEMRAKNHFLLKIVLCWLLMLESPWRGPDPNFVWLFLHNPCPGNDALLVWQRISRCWWINLEQMSFKWATCFWWTGISVTWEWHPNHEEDPYLSTIHHTILLWTVPPHFVNPTFPRTHLCSESRARQSDLFQTRIFTFLNFEPFFN